MAKRGARDFKYEVDGILEEHGGYAEWIKKISSFTHWEQGHYDEGRMNYDMGTFDAEAAREDFKELGQGIHQIGENFELLLKTNKAAHEANEELASSSLIYSYLGLVLITFGFAIQIISLL